MENIQEYRDIKVNLWNSIKIRDKALFYEHLSNLVDGGVTIVNALEAFLEKTNNPKMAREVANLLLFIDSGDCFSISMKKLPEVFGKKEVAIIEAGESSGTIQKSFENLAIQLREQESLRQKVKSALTYPIIIMVFLVIAVLVIMTYVIPSLSELFFTAGTELPTSTKALINTSNFIIHNKMLIVIAFIFFILGLKSYSKSENGKKIFDELFLKIPIIGDVYRNYIIAQISSNLGLLIGAGIPIIKTLRLTGESSNNALYDEAINIIAEKVSGGKKLTQSIEETDPEHRYFPNDFIQMIGAGEKTSTINKICDKIHKQYTREVENSVIILTKRIEPIAILIAGLFVAWFAFSMFSAVIKLMDVVG